MYQGIGMVNGKKKILTEFKGETIPLSDIEDEEEQRQFFLRLTRGAKF